MITLIEAETDIKTIAAVHSKSPCEASSRAERQHHYAQRNGKCGDDKADPEHDGCGAGHVGPQQRDCGILRIIVDRNNLSGWILGDKLVHLVLVALDFAAE